MAAAFVIASFGWGLGFYGPSIYLKTVQDNQGWSLGLTSAAVTLHFLIGAVAVVNLPRLHRRFGLPAVTLGGAIALALGIAGWAFAMAPWQLLVATLFSGCGWITLGAAGINAMVSPWFAAERPKALSMAYNGASIGGVIFSPLWVALIAAYGFRTAALVIGATVVVSVACLARTVLRHTPQSMGLFVDGQTAAALISTVPTRPVADLSGSPWRDAAFTTLSLGMALGLFAQIGLIAHLYSLLTPAMGPQWAGFAMGMATAAAILGRSVVGWTLRPGADRRKVAAANHAVQIIGVLCLVMAAGSSLPWLVLGIFLFGLGIGNATSLPPLIAQVEFASADTARVVALVMAVAQSTYAFAPWVFGLVRDMVQPQDPSSGLAVYLACMLIQAMAAACYLAGKGKFRERLGSV